MDLSIMIYLILIKQLLEDMLMDLEDLIIYLKI